MPRQRKSTSPMFSARHYASLAGAISMTKSALEREADSCATAGLYYRAAHAWSRNEGVADFAYFLCKILATDNPNFKPEKFLKAAFGDNIPRAAKFSR